MTQCICGGPGRYLSSKGYHCGKRGCAVQPDLREDPIHSLCCILQVVRHNEQPTKTGALKW